MKQYPELNPLGRSESYDPWPELEEHRGVDMYRHDLGFTVVSSMCQSLRRENTRILDVGCGDGWLLSLLHQGGYRNIAGVDHSSVGLERMKRRAPSADAYQLDLTRPNALADFSADLVVCTELLEHLPRDSDVEQVTRSLLDLLEPGGKVFISVPNDSICNIDDDHRRLFMPGDQVTLLKDAGFIDVTKITYFYSPEYPYPWMMAAGLKEGRFA